jgi:hypothetical protein
MQVTHIALLAEFVQNLLVDHLPRHVWRITCTIFAPQMCGCQLVLCDLWDCVQETFSAILQKYAEFARCAAKTPLDLQLDIVALSQQLRLGLSGPSARSDTQTPAIDVGVGSQASPLFGGGSSLASSLWRQAASQWQQAGRQWHATSYVTPAPRLMDSPVLQPTSVELHNAWSTGVFAGSQPCCSHVPDEQLIGADLAGQQSHSMSRRAASAMRHQAAARCTDPIVRQVTPQVALQHVIRCTASEVPVTPCGNADVASACARACAMLSMLGYHDAMQKRHMPPGATCRYAARDEFDS